LFVLIKKYHYFSFCYSSTNIKTKYLDIS